MTQSDIYAVRTGATYIMGRLSDKSAQTTSLQDVIATILKDFKFVNNDALAFDMAHGGAIDFGALHREITTIYLIAPIDKLDPQGMGKWLRLFINLALRAMYQNPPPDPAPLPRVLFILDEFAQLGRLQDIPKALGALRDFSGCFWFVLQNLPQLKMHYPKEWSLFFTGSGVKSCFRCADLETAEYFSKLLGNREQYVMTENPAGGMSLNQQALPLIRPEDLMRLPPRVTVNLIDPCPYPILANVPIYTQTPWNEGLDPNPYYRG